VAGQGGTGWGKAGQGGARRDGAGLGGTGWFGTGQGGTGQDGTGWGKSGRGKAGLSAAWLRMPSGLPLKINGRRVVGNFAFLRVITLFPGERSFCWDFPSENIWSYDLLSL